MAHVDIHMDKVFTREDEETKFNVYTNQKLSDDTEYNTLRIANRRDTLNLYLSREQLWTLATAVTDALMQDELTEVDLTAMDTAFLKIATKYQDCEAVNGY